MEIAEFLLARIADDERAAQAERDWMIERHGPDVWTTGEGRHLGAEEWQYETDRDLTLHVSPRRVLAECEAKRRIVDAHPLVVATNIWGGEVGGLSCQTCDEVADLVCGGYAHERSDGCATLRLLALPYADHPDYDPEWRV